MSQKISALALGSKIAVPVMAQSQSRYGKTIVFTAVDMNHKDYPDNTVTLMTDKLIAMMAFDAAEPTNTASSRRSYGNSRYLYANIRLWLNSRDANWYAPQHQYDAPPTDSAVTYSDGYQTRPGFLSIFPAEFVKALQDTTILTGLYSNDTGSAAMAHMDTDSLKMYLPGQTEVGLGNPSPGTEGTVFAYLNSNAVQRQAYPTEEAVVSAKYKNSSLNADAKWNYWLRTAYYSYSHETDYVNTNGTLSYTYCDYSQYGIRPVCNISGDALVSDTPNADGYYDLVITNKVPTITGEDGDIGTKKENFVYTYTVADPEGKPLTVAECVDNGEEVVTANVANNTECTLEIDADTFLKLTNGQHTIRISVTDVVGDTTMRNLTFTKLVDTLTITLKDPRESLVQPKYVLLNIARNIPTGATWLVEVSNNPFDTNPVWEDMTADVEANRAHIFTNTVNAASKKGLNLRVTARRNAALDPCWISSIDGSFE